MQTRSHPVVSSMGCNAVRGFDGYAGTVLIGKVRSKFDFFHPTLQEKSIFPSTRTFKRYLKRSLSQAIEVFRQSSAGEFEPHSQCIREEICKLTPKSSSNVFHSFKWESP